MLIRPAHKDKSYRTIMDVKWREKDGVKACSVTFLMHVKNGEAEQFMKTPWYPDGIFWKYWARCDSE